MCIADITLIVQHAGVLGHFVVDLLGVENSNVCIAHAICLGQECAQSFDTARDYDDLFSQIHLARQSKSDTVAKQIEKADDGHEHGPGSSEAHLEVPIRCVLRPEAQDDDP